MLSIKVKRNKNGPQLEPGMIPTRFKQFVIRKKRRLNTLTPEAKVVAALTKCLAMQGSNDKNSYYIAGEEMFCPEITETEGAPKKPGGEPLRSYAAKGRFKIGKVNGEHLRYGVMEFRIKFRDGENEMGLPDIIIESADMNELSRNASLRG
jgi:hypothetical protein